MRFSLAASLALVAAAFAAPITERDSNYGTATCVALAGPRSRCSFFYQGGNPGSCGWYSQDSDYVVAVDSAMMSDWMCGKSIWVKNTNVRH